MNFSVTGDLAHCWRHSVSLNALQYLCVQSGYMSCLDAGAGHSDSGAGYSKATGDNGAIFYAWLEAKKRGYISKDDPLPTKGLLYIAQKNKLIKFCIGGKLPPTVYRKVLKIVEEEY